MQLLLERIEGKGRSAQARLPELVRACHRSFRAGLMTRRRHRRR
ncbi:hypothetical protein PE067_06385 [Paracoccus sp. DMF-8]|nr:hypothetical protein [Paracoccus sp. DMF-8]MDF3605805.1 hypothetical protein [Paracoccus sp. DMF-8]